MSDAIPRFTVFAFVLASAVSCNSCQGPPPRSVILVGHPQAVARERLVARRQEETQWLRTKLGPYQPTTQGLRDVRTFDGFISKLGLNYSPATGGLAFEQGKTATEQAQHSRDISQLQSQLLQLQLEQQIAELRRQIAEGVSPSPITAQPPTTDGVTQEQLQNALAILEQKLQASIAQAKMEMQSAEVLSADSSLGKVPDHNIVKSAADLHPIDALEDEMAYRSTVHAALLGTELDDTHDLSGGTLYTFRFPVTVATQQATSAIAKVELTPDVPDNEADHKYIYYQWRAAVHDEVRRECLRMQRQYRSGNMPDEDRSILIADLSEHLGKLYEHCDAIRGQQWALIHPLVEPELEERLDQSPKESELDATAEEVLRQLRAEQTSLNVEGQNGARKKGGALRTTGDAQANIQKAAEAILSADNFDAESISALDREWLSTSNDKAQVESLKMSLMMPEADRRPPERSDFWQICRHLVRRYEFSLEKLVTWEKECIAVGPEEIPEYVPQLRNTPYPDIELRFKEKLKKLNSCAQVYEVAPRMVAQNISDVVAAEKLRDFILALQVILPGIGLGLDSYSEMINRSQSRLQAMQRVPLVVGFSSSMSFGWLFGPRFVLDEKEPGKVAYRFAADTRWVQASLVVPAWAEKVKFKVRTAWVDPCTGKSLSKGDSEGSSSNGGSDGESQQPEISVHLSRNYEALTRAIMELGGMPRSGPRILMPASTTSGQAPYRLVAGLGTPQHLVIRGTNLWRNPVVLAGSQKATSVEILPDMLGIRAEFKGVSLPAGAEQFANAELRIVTAQGEDVVRDGVAIMRAPGSGTGGAIEPFLRLRSREVEFDDTTHLGRLEFDLVGPGFPNGFHTLEPEFENVTENEVALEWKIPAALDPLDPVSGVVSWTLTTPDSLTKPARANVDVRLRSRPGEALVSTLTDDRRTFVVFPEGYSEAADFVAEEVRIDVDGFPKSQSIEVRIRHFKELVQAGRLSNELLRGPMFLVLGDERVRLRLAATDEAAILSVDREWIRQNAPEIAPRPDDADGNEPKETTHGQSKVVIGSSSPVVVLKIPGPLRLLREAK